MTVEGASDKRETPLNPNLHHRLTTSPRRRTPLAAVLVAVAALTAILAGVSLPPPVSAYSPHAPIYINGNTGFTPANGVTGGSGTPVDPYIIEGWEIDASTANGIEVRLTTAPFIIRSVYVHSGGTSFSGIRLNFADNGTLENATLSNNNLGIDIQGVTDVTVTANNISANNDHGMYLYNSEHVLVSANNVSSNGRDGISLYRSSNVTLVANNVFSNSGSGIELASFAFGGNVTVDENVTAVDNNVSSNGDGITLYDFVNATLTGNVFSSNGVVISGRSVVHYNSHNITPDNLVNGEPLYYYRDRAGVTIDGVTIGQLIVANCTDVLALNLDISDTDRGLGVFYSTRVTITANHVTSTDDFGIFLYRSSDALIAANNVSSNGFDGIGVWDGLNVTVTGNQAWDNWIGIDVVDSTDTVVTDNDVLSGRGFGIWVESIFTDSTNVEVTGNRIKDTRNGIYLDRADGVQIGGNDISTTDGRGISIDLATNSTAEYNNLTSVSGGGVRVRFSENITLAWNAIGATILGIEVANSANLRVYRNDLIGNLVQAMDDNGPENVWNDDYPSGGNYWSDYGGVDLLSGPAQDQPGPDGIGDTPYVIDADSQDRYPLMSSRIPAIPPRLVAATLSGAGDRDLDLTWEASADEGLLGGTTDYRILRSSALAGPFTEVASVPANGSPTYTFTCSACGHVPGDTNLTFYRIQAVTATNQTADSNLAARYAAAVQPGPNLLTVPLEQSDYGVAAVLRTMAHGTVRSYDSADATDPWKAFYIGRTGDLATANFGEALWVTATAAGQYTVAGLVRANHSLALAPGWNLVAYASFVPETAAASLAGVPGVARVETLDPSGGAQPYRLRALSLSEVLVPGEAYWIHVVGAGGPWQQG